MKIVRLSTTFDMGGILVEVAVDLDDDVLIKTDEAEVYVSVDVWDAAVAFIEEAYKGLNKE